MTMSRLSAAVLVAALGLAGCKEEEVAAPVRPVLSMVITPITTQMFGPFASTVEARYQTQLGFQTSGRMIARDVYVGDRVTKGQRLAALDPTVTQFALMRAKADVADAKAQLANAEGIASRQGTLAAGGNATQAAMDNAVAGRDTAKARLAQMQAALRSAEDQMSYTELHANFDGVVTAWSAEVGQYVSNGQAVVTVARPDIREAVVDIPDDLMFQVKPDMEFTVRLAAAPNVTVKGKVREIGPLADSATRSHRVRLTLEDPASSFRIGTTITAGVERSIPPTIVIPASAVLDEQGKHYVWLLTKDQSHVDKHQIEVDPADDGKMTVTSGLEGGDRIVVVGVHSLAQGQAVAGEADASTKAKGTRL